jgi:hypothetical protein
LFFAHRLAIMGPQGPPAAPISSCPRRGGVTEIKSS